MLQADAPKWGGYGGYILLREPHISQSLGIFPNYAEAGSKPDLGRRWEILHNLIYLLRVFSDSDHQKTVGGGEPAQ